MFFTYQALSSLMFKQFSAPKTGMFSLENGKKSAFQYLQIYPVGENSSETLFSSHQ